MTSNSALTNCRRCKSRISSTASFCPTCGYKVQGMSFFGKFVLVVIGLFVASSIFNGVMTDVDRQAKQKPLKPGLKGSEIIPSPYRAPLDPISELVSAKPSPLQPYGELAELFALGGRHTDLQRENKLREIRGQIVQWTLPVYDISRSGNRYRIQTKSTMLALPRDTPRHVGTFILITPRNDLDVRMIEALKTDDMVAVKGRISDVTMRNLVLDPAVLAYGGSGTDTPKE